MPIDKNKPFDPEYFDDDSSLFEDEIELEEKEDVLDQDDVDSLEEVDQEDEYNEDGYGGGVEGIYNWDEWN